MQNDVIYLVLKRLRAPLILLILSYTVAIVGLTLIPGVDEHGNTRHISYFHAFYFFSYVATTIGFGEIPYQFNDIQRIWVTFCIYLTVISWLVAIGQIISLLQDKAFKMAITKYKFLKTISRINQKFFIVCGYGETGEILVRHLISKGFLCVVIDQSEKRINLLDLDNTIYNIPFLLADASETETLRLAGIESQFCKAVIALTNSDSINIKISIASKLLSKKVKVVCRTESREAVANAKSFNTDHILNPYRIFAENMSMCFRTPSVHQVILTLLQQEGSDYPEKIKLPKGRWIVCGYDYFGQEVTKFLDYEGMDISVIDLKETKKNNFIRGLGTEAITLKEAGIQKAVGVIAGTKNDADNLSIIMTAKNLRYDLYTVARENLDSNHLIFRNAGIDLVMESARLLVWQITPLLIQPYLAKFFKLARHKDEEWANDLLTQLKEVSPKVPEIFIIKINSKYAQAALKVISSGSILRLQDILLDSKDLTQTIPVLPLMMIRDKKEMLLPKQSISIKENDIFLIAGTPQMRHRVRNNIYNENELYYLINGKERPVSIVLTYLHEKWQSYKKSKKL